VKAARLRKLRNNGEVRRYTGDGRLYAFGHFKRFLTIVNGELERHTTILTAAPGEFRFAFYYAAVFGSLGALAPFLALWLSHIGLKAADIGVIVAAPSVVMLFTTVLIGRWADALRDRRVAIVCCNVAIALVHCAFFFTTHFWAVLIIWVLSGVAMYAMLPITDASALRLTQRNNSDAGCRLCL